MKQMYRLNLCVCVCVYECMLKSVCYLGLQQGLKEFLRRVRCGVVWCGVVRCSEVRCGEVWCGVVCCGAVR